MGDRQQAASVSGNGFAVAVLKSFSKGMPISAPPIPKRMNFGMNPVDIGRDKGPPVFLSLKRDDTVLPAPPIPPLSVDLPAWFFLSLSCFSPLPPQWLLRRNF
jgi:hypothetical protein